MTKIFTIQNVTPAILQEWQTLIQNSKYAFSVEYNSIFQTLVIKTNDNNVITFLTGKGFTAVTDTSLQYDDTKTITDVETAILGNTDTSTFRPELINKYKSTLANLQNQAKTLNIPNWQTMTISQLHTAISSSSIPVG